MHTAAEVADMSDVNGCIELIAEFVCTYIDNAYKDARVKRSKPT